MPPADRQLLQTAPGRLPLVGHVPAFLRDRLACLTRCADTDAAVVRLVLDADAYLLLEAQDVKHVLETNYPNYDKGDRLTSSRGRRLSGSGLLTSSGREHLEKRKAIQPSFAPSSVTPLVDAMIAEIDRSIRALRDGQTIDIAVEMMDLAQNINGRILFGADYRGADAPLAQAIRTRRDYVQHTFSSLLPFADRIPTRRRAAFNRAQVLIDADVRRRIAQRHADPNGHADLLARLAHALDDGAAHEEAVTTAITGYETIGEGLGWTCLLLAQHPEIAEKVTAEIDAVLGDRMPTEADVSRLNLTGMVLSESMRLYPPTWIYLRVARGADRLPSGVELPAGARIYVCPWVLHRSRRYFVDPLRFDPSRFEEEARKARPKYAYFPFGGGPRVCIGQWVAKMQMPLMLAMLTQLFTWELLPGQNIKPEPKITLRPAPGIRVRLRARRGLMPATASPSSSPNPQ